ncbi:MAG: winged helix-turn-helix domain-containing protein [Polaromonas sp.]|nr:winged helix-turn-helix domain-containing protein [Polaromonas sp.]
MPTPENHLVALLPRKDRARFLAACEHIDLRLADVLSDQRFHQIGPRLARWLLMSQDRSNSDSFDLTQEFLAYMLGARRVGITAAAGALQKSGVIAYSRGKLTVLDRRGLEKASCSCYKSDQKTYSRLIGNKI